MYIQLTYFLENELNRFKISVYPFSDIERIDLFHNSTINHLQNFLEKVYTKAPNLKIRLVSHLGIEKLQVQFPLIERFKKEYGIVLMTYGELAKSTQRTDVAVLLFSHKADINKNAYKMSRRAFILNNAYHKYVINGNGSIFKGSFFSRVIQKIIRSFLKYLVPLRDAEERRLIYKNMLPDPGYDIKNPLIEGLCNHTNRLLLTKFPYRIEQCVEDGVALKTALLSSEYETELYKEGYYFPEFSDERPDWNAQFEIYQQRRFRNMQNVGLHSAEEFDSNPSALDVGCGTGLLTDKLDKLGFDSLGIDHSKYSIEAAKRNFPRLKFKVMRAEDVVALNKKFDLITLVHMLEHIRDDKRLLDELKQLMKPTSCLYIEVPLFDVEPIKFRPFWYRQKDHYREYTRLGLYRLVTGVGYQVLAHKDSYTDEGNEPYQFLLAKLR